jgi:hypothetical protein
MRKEMERQNQRQGEVRFKFKRNEKKQMRRQQYLLLLFGRS